MKRPERVRRTSVWAPAICVIALGAMTASAVAGGRDWLRGPVPWDFPDRNRETAFAYQYARDNRRASDGSGAAAVAGALGSTVIINSNAYAVGNWQQIEMTLGDGAEGLIMTENHQDNSGEASAETRTLNDADIATEKEHETTRHENAQNRADRNTRKNREKVRRSTQRTRKERTERPTEPVNLCGVNASSCWGVIDPAAD